MVFEHIRLRMLNTIESWHHQISQTSPPGNYRDEQIENIAGIIRLYIDHPGVREVWTKVKHTFVPVEELVEDNISRSN